MKINCLVNEDKNNQEKELTFVKKLSICSNIFKSLIGLAILVLPKIVFQLGMIYGIIIILFSYFIFVYGTILLFEVLEKNNFNDKKYSKLVKIILGNNYENFTNFTIIFSQLSFCIAANILGAKFLNYLICLIKKDYCNKLNLIYLYSFIMAIPIIFIKKINTFSFISMISLFIIFFALFSIIITNLIFISSNNDKMYIVNKDILNLDFMLVPKLFGIALYAFEGIGVIIPLRYTIKPHYKKFEKYYLNVCHSFLLLILLIVITCIYKFGDNLKQIILLNYDKSHLFLLFLSICYIITIFFSFPLNLFPIYDIINASRFKIYLKNKFYFYGSRIILLLIIYGVVFFTPNFINFLEFIGSLITFIWGIFIPILLHFRTFKNKRKYFNYFYLLISFLICLYSQFDLLKKYFII